MSLLRHNQVIGFVAKVNFLKKDDEKLLLVPSIPFPQFVLLLLAIGLFNSCLTHFLHAQNTKKEHNMKLEKRFQLAYKRIEANAIKLKDSQLVIARSRTYMKLLT